ncbi:claspin [Nymphalis io]|uniref:claspin n=1 Tax=Inachis io TaxID=171585 RepID=UPI002168A4C4|nr:claspin [Nymphalis io]
MTEILNLNEDVSSESYLKSDINTERQMSKSPTLIHDEENFHVSKKRIQTFYDDDSDLDKENEETNKRINTSIKSTEQASDEEEVISLRKSNKKRSRIKSIQNSDSDSENSSSDLNLNEKPNHYESIRTENKKKTLKDKFKSLISSKSKDTEKVAHSGLNDSGEVGDNAYCIEIKQILRTSVNTMKSICDPDTSDEDSDREEKTIKKVQGSKKVKSTSPKPQKMSAKQAIENMQKIKSESNRMLREKEVSLPYHRPKALSLKDIMSRRKPAVTSDGKALPIKMNGEQLKQYAMMLEQRQKEVIELCKSDTEDEENEQEIEETVKNNPVSSCENYTEFTNNFQNTIDEKDINIDSKEENSNDNSKQIHSSDNENILEKDNDYNHSQNNDEMQVDEITEVGNTIDEKDINIDSKEENSNDNSKQIHSSDNENILEKDNDYNHSQNNDEMQVDEITEVGNSLKEKLNKSNEPEVNNSISATNEEGVHENDVISDCSHINTENESQAMALNFDSEQVSSFNLKELSKEDQLNTNEQHNISSKDNDSFDDELNYDEVDKFIEKAEMLVDIKEKSEEILTINSNLNPTPKLTGCPGSFINLDDGDPSESRRLSGVEILKERFTYFAKLNSLEEMDKDREKKHKPGTQHLKLKQELEQQISEQRASEWEKRLEEEKQQKSEADGNLSDEDIEKMEAKLEAIDADHKSDTESSESEEEPIEDDVVLKDKPKKRNPMVDDEAEESDCDDVFSDKETSNAELENKEIDCDADLEDCDDDSSDSSESEEEEEPKPRKGRILKAFEDSDDESASNNQELNNVETNASLKVIETMDDNDIIKESQDDDLQLAQVNKSSDDLFSTQESNNLAISTLNKSNEDGSSPDLGTQSFSIMNSVGTNHQTLNLNSPDKISVVCETQEDVNLDHIVGMCSGSFSENLVSLPNPPPLSQSQEIGDDIVNLCTGKFYDNPFVSQIDKEITNENSIQGSVLKENDQSQEIGDDVAALCTGKFYYNPMVAQNSDSDKIYNAEVTECPEQKEKETTILNSILDELDEPELDVPKQYKYFSNTQPKNKISIDNSQLKKKFVIDSDDENVELPVKKNKKLKKRKPEARALQISDDEEDIEEDQDDFESENEEEDRIVEYDSEENEVEVQLKPLKKKEKRVGEFFENEAELTSEDEWVGSGDEDERGLDRMEREEGDDDKFHQGQLQRQLGQIHMREVLDQDKREVRLLQELLFEDGDLGDGHRQRKFRWKNADGEMEPSTNSDEFADTQEDEFESEEQWRKQRHEREMFLRNMQEKDQENLDTSINRTTIIKANLNSRSMSTLISETKSNLVEKMDTIVPEKKTTKDIPSPKKSFTIFQQNYHGSLLTRGRGALARLAALATPLATDNDDVPKVIASSNRRNFVFTAVSNDKETKVTKRKADKINTPRLIKKMKTEKTATYIKNSLFDHLKT